MADYWKSQPRKFCQYCKCWIADNKPSRDFHERGKNHKENVAAKISEIKKKSIDKVKQEEKMSKEFKAMEDAAMKAYEEDLKRIEREAAGLSAPVPAAVVPQRPPLVLNQAKPEYRKQQKKKEKASRKAARQMETPVWVEGQTADGHAYFYNSVTGESRWENPGGLQGEGSTSEHTGKTESSSGCSWMEAVSPDGYTYYYNKETGESSWEKPADFSSNDASGSGSSKEVKQEEPSTPQPEKPSEGEESSSGAQVSKKTEAPEQASLQPIVSKISFRKRKAEAEPSEKEREDKASDDAPKENPKENPKEMKKEEEVQSKAAQPERKKKEVVTQRVTQGRKPKAANPYGTWEQIEEEEDPYASVDLQLPQVEGSTAGAPADLPPEPKPKFRERIITSLGDEGGSTLFRKNKTQNGKSRSLRQRDDDD